MDPYVILHLTFHLFLSFLIKIRWFHGSLKFLRGGGKYKYRHLKSLTKPKYKLPPDLVLKQDLFLESAFYNKKWLCPLVLKLHHGNLNSPHGSWATTVTVQDSFPRFWALTGTWALINRKKLQNPCTVTVVAPSPKGLQRFPRRHFKDNGQSYFYYKRHCPKKRLVVVLDEVEVYI